jgi:HEAT repeat protein
MSSLGTQDLGRSLEILRNCILTDSESDVRAAAADSVGGLKLQEVFPDLLELYNHTSDWVLRLSIIAALGELGAPQAFDILVEALDTSDDLLKLAAIGSLGELGDGRALPFLAPFVSDPDWQVRQRLAIALQHLGGDQAQILLATLAQDSDAQVAAAASIPAQA